METIEIGRASDATVRAFGECRECGAAELGASSPAAPVAAKGETDSLAGAISGAVASSPSAGGGGAAGKNSSSSESELSSIGGSGEAPIDRGGLSASKNSSPSPPVSKITPCASKSSTSSAALLSIIMGGTRTTGAGSSSTTSLIERGSHCGLECGGEAVGGESMSKSSCGAALWPLPRGDTLCGGGWADGGDKASTSTSSDTRPKFSGAGLRRGDSEEDDVSVSGERGRRLVVGEDTEPVTGLLLRVGEPLCRCSRGCVIDGDGGAKDAAVDRGCSAVSSCEWCGLLG